MQSNLLNFASQTAGLLGANAALISCCLKIILGKKLLHPANWDVLSAACIKLDFDAAHVLVVGAASHHSAQDPAAGGGAALIPVSALEERDDVVARYQRPGLVQQGHPANGHVCSLEYGSIGKAPKSWCHCSDVACIAVLAGLFWSASP